MGKKKSKTRERSSPDLQSRSSDTKSQNVYTSPPFKFIVEGQSFYLHAALVSQHSRPLDRMMNGDMSEAQKGYAVLKEVDEDTFGRFAEWANKGYYTPGEVVTWLDHTSLERSIAEGGECKKRMKSISEPAEELEESESPVNPATPVERAPPLPRYFAQRAFREPHTFNYRTIASPVSSIRESPNRNSPSRSQLKESFIHRKAVVRQESISIPPPPPNQGPDEEYTDVFLSHAQLYVFAEKYDIQTLKMLALENLQTTLAIFTLYEARTGDIIALLRYVYANTGEPIDGVEELRTLLTHYMGYEMDTLMKDEEFRDLMVADGGPLLGDYMKMVMKRIS
ncbi:MAG: hypothetical protein Q9199_000087 [Rusavskia elegans]